MKVIFSNRAYVALLSETQEKITTETGGIFLGYFENDNWYVVETIDPGPKSIFEVAYFEYDQKYVNHLINKIARLYKKNLSLLGLWHRHPGSFDIFSTTDDQTNRIYAQLAPQGAISAIVNIDPNFRLTVFHVPENLKYKKLHFVVGDQYFPPDVLSLLTREELEEKINKYNNAELAQSQQVHINPSVKFSSIINSVCGALNEFDGKKYKDEIFSAHKRDDFIEETINVIMEDLGYLSQKMNLSLKVKKTERYLCMFDESDESETRVYFSYIASRNEFVFIYKNTCYLYFSGLFKCTIEKETSTSNSFSLIENIRQFFTNKRR